MKYIKSFYFQSAKYLIADGEGNAIFLKMNYRDNKFKIELVKGKTRLLKEEAEMVAQKLLKKKHSVNFVERLEI